MADKLPLCLGKREDINIKSLAEIFFPQKIARAEVRNAEGFENSYACLLALAKRSDCRMQLRRPACARRYTAIFYVYCSTKFNPH